MSGTKYPADICTGLGWGRIHRGHGLDRQMLETDLTTAGELPRVGERMLVSEDRLDFRPRIKWCERVDGFGCDENGEWHAHWFPVRQNGEQFTVTQWTCDEATS